MDYYTLGRTGLKVSRLSLGAMTFGTRWGWGADSATARELFDTYVETGGNVIDTADLYTGGESERMVGAFVKDAALRDKLVIVSKFGFNAEEGNPNAGGNGRKNIIRAVEGSLARLGTDYLDLYLMHVWDRVTPAEEVMRTFDDLVTSGKVRYAGVSNVPGWWLGQAQTIANERGWEKLCANQMEYSLVARHLENEYRNAGHALGVGMMAWSPLGGGLLSGKYRPDATGEGRLAGTGFVPGKEKLNDRNYAIVAALEQAAESVGKTMAQVAINWVANRPAVATVILGATKKEQLVETLASLDFTLPDEVVTRLDEASRPELTYPYTFFTDRLQGMVTGGVTVGDKPTSY